MIRLRNLLPGELFSKNIDVKGREYMFRKQREYVFKEQQEQCKDCEDDHCQSKQIHSGNELKEITISTSTIIENPQKLIFKVEGMCCASEVESLKDVLNPLLNGRDANLAFDLINAKLTLESKYDNLPAKDEIIKAVAKAGMMATLWNEHVKQTQEKKTFWQRYGHITMNVVSAASLVVGFIFQAVRDGISTAFGGGIDSGQETERPDYPPITTMVFYSVTIVAGSWFILPKAVRTVRRLRLDTNVLMLTATAGAVGINHWFEAASSIYLFSAAEFLESWNMTRARKAIRALMELAPSTAQVINEEGIIIEQLVEQISIGTMITVRPGEKIPMDSILLLGSTSVNQAPITGESLPVQKKVGDTLFAGTINGDSVIQCKVTKMASDSTLASIIRKVEEAQSRRAKSDQLIEKFSRYYVPSMLAASVVVCVVPPLVTGGSWYPWVYKGLEFLVISCPCSLVISTPVSIVAGLTAAARAGVLIKGGIYLEMPAQIKAFAMDKTGTLTTGEPTVQNVIPLNNYNIKKVLKLAAALEIHSDHPLARAIQRKAKAEGIKYQPAEYFQIFKGKGAKGYINGKSFWIGSHRFLQEKVRNNEPKVVYEKIKELEATGHSIVALGHGKNIYGLISITDAVRPESKNAIQSLKRTGIERIVMLTGDNEGAAKTIADSIGIDEYYAELLPEDKVKQVESLVAKYKRVAMVGDGVNDAPAMAVSSLGIAMGTVGSDVAIETADIALMSDDLGKLVWLVNHSRRTLNIIKQNVIFSLAVKAAFVGLTFANESTLWMAILADMGASFIVVSNGLRLLNDRAGCFGKFGRGASQRYEFKENQPSSSQLLKDIALLTSVETQTKTALKLELPPTTISQTNDDDCSNHCGGTCHTSTSKKVIDESKSLAKAQSLIGPEKIEDWILENVKDDGNCFYLAVVKQLKAINHPFINTIPSGTASNDSLRLLIQGKRFQDKEWAGYPEILRLAQKLKVIVSIVDTRHPDLGFVYHYVKTDDSLDHTNDDTVLPKDIPTIKIAFTGNHYLTVLKHPKLVQGRFTQSEDTQTSASHQEQGIRKKVKVKNTSLEIQQSNKNKAAKLISLDITDDLTKQKSATCKKSCCDTHHVTSPDLNQTSTIDPVINPGLDKKLETRLKNVQMITSNTNGADFNKYNDYCNDKCNQEKSLTISEKEVTPSLILQFDQSRRRQSQQTVAIPTKMAPAEELEQQIELVKKSCCQSKDCSKK